MLGYYNTIESLCMSCTSVWEDNPQSLSYCTSMSLHFVHCEIVDVKHRNINKKRNDDVNYIFLVVESIYSL